MKHDVVIIGAGIVGLATALKLKEKKPGLGIAIVEKEKDVALHQTGNNSGVIHAGIYYKPGSLKAKNCINGYRQLVTFCDKHSVPYEISGKIIVATKKDELDRLDKLYERGIQNGLTRIKKLKAEEIKEFEPCSTGIAAIHVPYTGIINFREVCNKYKHILENVYNCNFYFNHKVKDISINNKNTRIYTEQGTLETKLTINTAGLYSDKIARMTNHRLNVRIIPFRGEYYELKEEKKHLVKNLIYPVPDPNFPFLGIHFTRKFAGGTEAGPNAVLAFAREGYKKSGHNLGEMIESLTWPGFLKVMAKYWKTGLGEYYRSYNKLAFTKALQRLLPEIKKEDLVPGGAGVRAQACSRDGKLIDDFLFIEQKNMIHVLNAPSPAATASLAIGEHISSRVINSL